MTERARTTRSWAMWTTGWVLAALVLALIAISADNRILDVAWRVSVLGVGGVAGVLAWRRNGMPLPIAMAIIVSGCRLALVSTGDLVFTIADATWAQAGTDLAAGTSLVVALLLAIRARRGRLGLRELVDGSSVLFGAGLAAWAAIAHPALVDGADPVLAVATAAYMPVAFMLVAYALELMLDGLTRNRTMWLILVATGVNLGATVIRSSIESSRPPAGALHLVAAMLVVAHVLGCAGICHRDAPRVLRRRTGTTVVPRHEIVRLVPLGLSLVTAGYLISFVDPTSTADRAIRATLTVSLAVLLMCRLYFALDGSLRVQQQLERRLDHDDLTDLPTRPRFLAEVAAALETHWSSQVHPTLIQVNVDRFKNFNDTLGHDAANYLLVRLAERLNDLAGHWDGIVARSGGDEFVILDHTTLTDDDALARATAVSEALSRPIVVDDIPIFVTASIGVATAPTDRSVTAEEMLRRVDIATHRAKADGRNRAVLFDDSMHSNLARRMDVENALHGAIGRNEMLLYHQPIVDIVTGHLVGFEALIRWQRDGDTIVSPADFIAIAEETGLIGELGAWALERALSDLRRWIDDGLVASNTTMSVNVSPRQIADPDFADVVRAALEASGVPANLLWLEMTESMMLEEPALAERTLRDIRSMGVRLALDDFGTGYSSLSLLQQFPIHRIKIDRVFVQGIVDRSNDRSLVRTIIAMAQSMGLDVVAEGVETVHQLRSLRELGCDKAQGYLISRPVPTDAMRSTLVALGDLASLSLFGDDVRSPADGPGRGTDHLGGLPSRPLGNLATMPMG